MIESIGDDGTSFILKGEAMKAGKDLAMNGGNHALFLPRHTPLDSDHVLLMAEEAENSVELGIHRRGGEKCLHLLSEFVAVGRKKGNSGSHLEKYSWKIASPHLPYPTPTLLLLSF